MPYALIFLLLAPFILSAAETVPWKAGTARVDITPPKPLWMMGFGARKKPSEGVVQPLWAKALALEDAAGRRSALVTSDILGFPATVAANIAAQVRKRYGIPRERLMLNSSHTHCGPAIANPRKYLYGARTSEEQNREIEEYTQKLEAKVVAVVGEALNDLRPARLGFARGETGFGINRRVKTPTGWASSRANPNGPVDHEVPVLRIVSEQGGVRGVVFGYACHATAVTAGVFQFNGDYPGFAQQQLEKEHPGATAFFVAGCGGDVGTSPRGTVEHARKYGEQLAAAVGKAMSGAVSPVRGPLRPAYRVTPLKFAEPPSREELTARLNHRTDSYRWHARQMLDILDRDRRLPPEYPYPIQVWQFGGDLTWIALAGEVVVDYSLRLKRELGADRLWVSGYSNDVFAYIPSLRVLQEGGYEGADAMVVYVQPAPWAPTVEETIVGNVLEMVRKLR